MLLVDSIEIDEDVMQFSFEVAGQRIICLTHFSRNGDEMRLFGLHLGGNARNKVGLAALWAEARELGRYFGVKTLRIEGGRRTTGLLKGQVPAPKIILIPSP